MIRLDGKVAAVTKDGNLFYCDGGITAGLYGGAAMAALES